jgi:hypothetical protein
MEGKPEDFKKQVYKKFMSFLENFELQHLRTDMVDDFC